MAHCSDERVARQGSEALMKVEVPYGETTITADLPANTRLLSNVERASLPPLPDLDGAVRAALSAPRGLPRIGALVRPGATVTMAFDDHTTGSFGPIRRVAIQAVLDELEGAGVRRRDVTLICANASIACSGPSSLPASSAMISWRSSGIGSSVTMRRTLRRSSISERRRRTAIPSRCIGW